MLGIEQVTLCMKLADIAHKGQLYAGKPYFDNHVMKVYENIRQHSDCPVMRSSALLHDVIEDTEETEESLLEKGVEQEILDVVKKLTREPGVSYDEYIESLLSCPKARAVKFFDAQANAMQCCIDGNEKRAKKYFKVMAKVFMKADGHSS